MSEKDSTSRIDDVNREIIALTCAVREAAKVIREHAIEVLSKNFKDSDPEQWEKNLFSLMDQHHILIDVLLFISNFVHIFPKIVKHDGASAAFQAFAEFDRGVRSMTTETLQSAARIFPENPELHAQIEKLMPLFEAPSLAGSARRDSSALSRCGRE